MFYVTSLDGSQVEPLINISKDFKMEQSVDGTFTVSFSCFPGANNPGYELLQSDVAITIADYKFKVKQFSKKPNSKTVAATSDFFELSGMRIDNVFEGTHTLANHLNFVLGGTGWNYTVDASIAHIINYIEKLGESNRTALIEKLCKHHNCESIILPGHMRVHFARQIGPDNDDQYRYKYNISDVVLKEDTNDLYTFVKGYGADGLEVSYTSPNASIFGIKEADPIRDDHFTDAVALTEFIKAQLQDVPKLAIESRIPELTERETGEHIWLIYEPLGIELKTRILKQTKVIRDGKLVTESVVFGNTLIKSAVDILVTQQEQINDNVDDIEETKEELTEAKVEYRAEFIKTDQRIALEVEQLNTSIAIVDVKADNINLSVNNRITNEVAAIDVRANQIEMSVNDLATSTSGSINLLSDQLQLKIDQGGSITDINLTPGVATINAEKINFHGHVFGQDSTWTGDITTSRDINIGRQLTFDFLTSISSNGGSLFFESYGDIVYSGNYHIFYGYDIYINGLRVLTEADL